MIERLRCHLSQEDAVYLLAVVQLVFYVVALCALIGIGSRLRDRARRVTGVDLA